MGGQYHCRLTLGILGRKRCVDEEKSTLRKLSSSAGDAAAQWEQLEGLLVEGPHTQATEVAEGCK